MDSLQKFHMSENIKLIYQGFPNKEDVSTHKQDSQKL